MRKCPNCQNKISLWAFFKPGLKKSAGPIICNKCDSTISPPWSRFNWFGLLGYGLCALLLKQIPQVSLGIESKLLYYFILISSALVMVMSIVYFTMPLNQKYNESINND